MRLGNGLIHLKEEMKTINNFKDITGQKFGRLTALYRGWNIEKALEL